MTRRAGDLLVGATRREATVVVVVSAAFATRSRAEALRFRPEVAELVQDDIVPLVGAHTGAGTVGACFYPES